MYSINEGAENVEVCVTLISPTGDIGAVTIPLEVNDGSIEGLTFNASKLQNFTLNSECCLNNRGSSLTMQFIFVIISPNCIDTQIPKECQSLHTQPVHGVDTCMQQMVSECLLS